MVRPMVHSNKHYVQTSIATITGGQSSNISLVQSVAVANKDSVFEVEEGSTIKAVYVEHWWKAGSASNVATGIATIHKIPGGGSNFTFAEMAALGSAANKKNILYTTQGLVNTVSGSAINFIKGWIKIPKSKQRFGLGDFLMLSISASASIDLHHCGFATYKEYT